MFERIRQARRTARERVELDALIEDCRQLLTERGESNSLVIAARALERYRALSEPAVHQLFEVLAGEFDPDPAVVLQLAQAYAAEQSPENLIALMKAAEPPRQELLRRLNRAPDGTGALVAMRARLLQRLRQQPALKSVDADLQHLLSSWFNPGFLTLRQVDWNAPAQLLEKIIQHEAVHEIDGWTDLRRRLEPDRRCFAFFHPMLPDEPLIFVEVALLDAMPAAIAPLLDRRSVPETREDRFKVAVFYSISNCQPGLRGVNLGNFLIKRVAERLQQSLPKLKTFCTLSPIPSFASWYARVEHIESPRLKPAVQRELNAGLQRLRERHGRDLSPLVLPPAEGAPARSRTAAADLQMMQRLCAFYLTDTSPTEQRASDPVARFHLNNGARLERINAAADLSRNGLRQSFGQMVNYLYDLDEIESNHDRFVNDQVSTSKAVLGLL
ncbi:MAG: malonyl-CoA decarboxylase [Burkholderiales bacterium]|nr:malonyl-CoA decarboxylase [Burkholderiales bacterium]